jgi:hypothetical protein
MLAFLEPGRIAVRERTLAFFKILSGARALGITILIFKIGRVAVFLPRPLGYTSNGSKPSR